MLTTAKTVYADDRREEGSSDLSASPIRQVSSTLPHAQRWPSLANTDKLHKDARIAMPSNPQSRMTIRLFNTLSSTIEDLIPAGTTTFGMYACGPTVYDYGHIGNFRTFLQVDVLRRFLKQQGIASATS